MEDDKKKKRNKKKKNKQNNKRVDDALASGATTSVDENHIGDGDVPQISGGPDADESQSSHQIDVVATEDDSGVENKSQGSEVWNFSSIIIYLAQNYHYPKTRRFNLSPFL